MAQIINAYANGNSAIADSLKSLGNSMFANQAQQGLVRNEALRKQQQNDAATAASKAYQANDQVGLGAAALQYDPTFTGMGKQNTARQALVPGMTADAPSMQVRQIGAGEGAGTTFQGTREAQAATSADNAARIAEQARQFNQKPEAVMGPNGLPIYSTQQGAIGQPAPLTGPAVEGASAARDLGLLNPTPSAQPGGPGAPPRTMGSPIGVPPAPAGTNAMEVRKEAGKNIADENKAATEAALGAVDFLTQSEDAKKVLRPMPDAVFGPQAGTMNTVRGVVSGAENAVGAGDPLGVKPNMAAYATKQGLLNNLAASKFREKFGARPTQMEYGKMLETVGGLNTPDAKTAVQQLELYEQESYTKLQNAVQRGLIRPENIDPAIIQRGIASGRLDPRVFGQPGQQTAAPAPTDAIAAQGAPQFKTGGGPILQQARAAILAGKSRAAVMQRLQQMGVDPAGL